MDERFEKINFTSKNEIPLEEMFFEFFRSSGPGGQNVNKVSTGVRVRWNIEKSNFLTDEQKERLKRKYLRKITKEGDLILESEETRSQLRNKEVLLSRLNNLINEISRQEKKRKKTNPPKSATDKRIKEKKETSEKKKRRQKPIIEKEI